MSAASLTSGPRIGFIGIGLMGEAMCRRLLARGHGVTVWNREPERVQLVLPFGATAAASPAEVAAATDIVLLCVFDDQAVEDCVLGELGVARVQDLANRLLIDLSTITPASTRDLAARAARQAGLRWIDAPVSGGPAAALEGSLTIMTGGTAEDMAEAAPILDCLGSNVTHMGPLGAGQTAKVLNQAIVGAGFVLMSEVALLAEAAGIDATRLPSCLAGGLADSMLLQNIYPRIHARTFDPPIGYARQLSKDMQAVRAFARDNGCDLPLMEEAAERYAAYVGSGAAMADSTSIIRLYEAEASTPSPRKKNP
ncbi:NAD(P)-dependent oxidoreductase [Variovorax ginsengisoli]|uniref:NAD(P)-dependent oxidoreductase n=1 Tax=Variovorax ginsengisoli TaxID=363844 RepID=A0ABT8S565_9BURK|nr:NAD(P)-dependent oxidoreductase [Variovorax ginsengisoli]MDN8614887.1 NAD(P)-dependent oxidoreductase [Variovorax ginsengisoli]MDO1534057.1 NAD(P)-dependent oxidoreductase [Variovorax ginsengisoli]